MLSRQIAELGIYPAVIHRLTSRMLDPRIVGDEHYAVARNVQEVLQQYKSLQDIIAISEWMNYQKKINWLLPEPGKSSFLSQPFHVAEVFTGLQAGFLEDTIKGFKVLWTANMTIYQKPLSIW